MDHLKCKFALIALLTPIFALPASAKELEPLPICDAKHLGSAKVAKVLDTGILQLESGEMVRLMGVMPLKLFNNPKSPVAKKLNIIARQAISLLRSELEGKQVELHQSGRTHDRYNRLLAHVYSPDGKWLQGLLLRKGLARSYSYRDNRACMKQMLQLEKTARKRQRGLWHHQAFQPKHADRQKQLMRKRYRFTLVEGRILKIAIVKGWVFLNFGDNWRRDFTIAIKRKFKRRIERDGLDLEKLKGKRVRVRGWMESWNGPAIKVTHKEQIELLDAD